MAGNYRLQCPMLNIIKRVNLKLLSDCNDSSFKYDSIASDDISVVRIS